MNTSTMNSKNLIPCKGTVQKDGPDNLDSADSADLLRQQLGLYIKFDL